MRPWNFEPASRDDAFECLLDRLLGVEADDVVTLIGVLRGARAAARSEVALLMKRSATSSSSGVGKDAALA